jgi:hypothetical protein
MHVIAAVMMALPRSVSIKEIINHGERPKMDHIKKEYALSPDTIEHTVQREEMLQMPIVIAPLSTRAFANIMTTLL